MFVGGLFLWHIDACGLFDAKFFHTHMIYMRMVCWYLFLNELELICLHKVKWFQVFLFNIINCIYQEFLSDTNNLRTAV